MKAKALRVLSRWPSLKPFISTLVSLSSALPPRSTATSASLPPLFPTQTAILAPEGICYCVLACINNFSTFSLNHVGQFSNLSQYRDLLKPIHPFAKSLWIRWSHISRSFYPTPANHCLSLFSYQNGESQPHLFLKDWKNHRGRDVRLLCPPSNTNTDMVINTSSQSNYYPGIMTLLFYMKCILSS